MEILLFSPFISALISIATSVSQLPESKSDSPFPSPPFHIFFLTALCSLVAVFALRRRSRMVGNSEKKVFANGETSNGRKRCDCNCSCSIPNGNEEEMEVALRSMVADTSGEENSSECSRICEREQSMMEQLVPEITTHALSYLDYPSLCRLSMTNSSMRRAANDDNAWKALYHKDFTVEQDTLNPANGWKAYYASTKAILTVNAEFYNIIRDRSLPGMSRLWLRADYVNCIHGSGELFSGYDAVMESWAMALNWHQGMAFHIQDVRVRVVSKMAWVSLKAYIDANSNPFNVTNIFEFHNGRWYLVHHHSSVVLGNGG